MPDISGFVTDPQQRAVVYSETRDLAVDQEPIANLISRCALLENFYLNNNPGIPGEADEEVRDKIVALYTTIILYQLATYKFWKQGKITRYTKPRASQAQRPLEFDQEKVRRGRVYNACKRQKVATRNIRECPASRANRPDWRPVTAGLGCSYKYREQ